MFAIHFLEKVLYLGPRMLHNTTIGDCQRQQDAGEMALLFHCHTTASFLFPATHPVTDSNQNGKQKIH
jgi:hypothetical protein